MVSVTLTQHWIVIYSVNSWVQLTSIWNLMDKFIPQLNFKQIVTQQDASLKSRKNGSVCYFPWKPRFYWNSILFFLFFVFIFCWRDNSGRVRTHEKNSGDSVRRFGIIIQKFFCAQSGASIDLLVGNGLVSRYPGALLPALENFVRAFFPDPRKGIGLCLVGTRENNVKV